MKGNWFTLWYHLVVLCGIYTAVQGARFPMKIDAVMYEGGHLKPTLCDNRNSNEITLLRNQTEFNSYDVWVSKTRNAERKFLFSFKIVKLRSVVTKAISIVCHSTLSTSLLNVRLQFNSRNDERDFHYDEIFSKKIQLLSSRSFNSNADTGSFMGAWRTDNFNFMLADVLLYNNGRVRRVAQHSILEQMLIRDKKNEVVSQFYVRPVDTELFSTDVIFTERAFNVSRVMEDRIVLGIWMDKKTTDYVCLVFAEQAHASMFLKSISSYIQRDIDIQQEPADALLFADLTAVAMA